MANRKSEKNKSGKNKSGKNKSGKNKSGKNNVKMGGGSVFGTTSNIYPDRPTPEAIYHNPSQPPPSIKSKIDNTVNKRIGDLENAIKEIGIKLDSLTDNSPSKSNSHATAGREQTDEGGVPVPPGKGCSIM